MHMLSLRGSVGKFKGVKVDTNISKGTTVWRHKIQNGGAQEIQNPK